MPVMLIRDVLAMQMIAVRKSNARQQC